VSHDRQIRHEGQLRQDAQVSQHGKDQDVPRSEQLPSARVEADLRRRLDAGEWVTGEALPPVAQLAGEYEVARGTVARVLAKLADEGLVRIVPRWGTFRA
jgi:DNA-binding GntR family transcriptional regulator